MNNPRLILALALALFCPRAFAAGPVAERPAVETAVEPSARLFAAWGTDVAGFSAMDDVQRGALVQSQIDAWTRDGAVDAIAAQSLGAEIESMALVEATMAQYAGDKLQALQAARRAATERRGALRAERLARGADSFTRMVSDLLDRTTTRSGAATAVSVVSHGGAQRSTTDDGRLQAAQALGRHLTTSYGLEHGRAVVDGLLRVGLAAESEAPRRAVVEVFSRDLLGSVSPVAALDPKRELQAMTAVAQTSQDRDTRALAAATALELSGFAQRSSGSGIFDFLTKPSRPRGLAEAARTALGQLAVSGPTAAVEAAPNDSASLAGMRRAARWSKWTSRLLGAVIALPTLGMIGPLGWLSAGAAAALILLVLFQGLSHHRAVFGYVQASFMVGGAFTVASALATATGPLGWAGLALAVGYAALMAGVAVWSFKTQRPYLGLLLNVLLLALL